jgi:hypothetical protein
MLALKPVAFDICVWSKAKVSKNHHVTVNGNFWFCRKLIECI